MATKTTSVSLTEFKRQSADAIRRLKRNGKPMVLTENGEADLVIQDAAAYRQLLEALDRAETIAGIRRGLEAVDRGETLPADEVFESIRRKYGIPR